MPSRMTFPPPNFTSSPYAVKSPSTSMTRSVSARRSRSPTVRPNISAYAPRLISWDMAFVLGLRQRTHHQPVEPEHEPRAAVRHELHFAGLTGLEPHGRSSGDIEAISDGGVTIERQGGVRLGEMKVTAT